jgi:hypothetical protein
MLLCCNYVPYSFEKCLQLHMMWSDCEHVVMYYSCVMNLIIPQWLRNRQWMKKVMNIELIYPLNTWSSCAYSVLFVSRTPSSRIQLFLLNCIFCFIHCMCVCVCGNTHVWMLGIGNFIGVIRDEVVYSWNYLWTPKTAFPKILIVFLNCPISLKLALLKLQIFLKSPKIA